MRRKRYCEEEATEAVNNERWLVSYADFMTLMFALFVVLFASSYHDKKALERVSTAVKSGFQDLEVFSSNQQAMHTAQPGIQNLSTSPALESNKAAQTDPTSGIDLLELQRKLHMALGKEIERKEVVLHMTPEGFVISLHELGFFNSGDAHLLPGAADKIKRIAAVLMQYGLNMRVEGHTDNAPIHNAQYDSNWDLSTARAMTVAMMLLDDGRFDPARLAIAGYGQYHPAASNDTPEGRRANRRVDIVVMSADKPAGAAPKQ
jgi:chemotaxis protein MotB